MGAAQTKRDGLGHSGQFTNIATNRSNIGGAFDKAKIKKAHETF